MTRTFFVIITIEEYTDPKVYKLSEKDIEDTIIRELDDEGKQVWVTVVEKK